MKTPMRGAVGLLAVLLFTSLVSGAYVPHEVEHDLYQVDLINTLKELVVSYTQEVDLLLPKYAPFPLESILENFKADITAVNNKYLTADYTFYAPVDGYWIASRSGMNDWYTDQLRSYRLKYQSHTYGSYDFKIIRYWPFTIEVHTTQNGNGMAEHPAYIPVPFMQQDKYIESDLKAHLIFQYTQVNGKWLMNYKNEDFSTLKRTCQHTCLGIAPHCSNSTCVVALANWNSVLNPMYPPPAGYVALRNPPVIFP